MTDDLIEKYFLKLAVIFLFISIVLLILGTIGNAYRMDEMNHQCLADGLKEYECYSILHVRK